MLLELTRPERKVYVQQMVAEAFDDWQFRKPSPEQFARGDEHCIKDYATWKLIPEECLDHVYPQSLHKEVWLWVLPALLLCCETEVSIGKHPISLGLPPLSTSNLDKEVVTFEELTGLCDSKQLIALKMYVELYNWLRFTDEEYSHWEERWKALPL